MMDLRVAVAVIQSPLGRIEDNLERTRHWSRCARDAGADIVCFPEMSITGYGNHAIIAELAQPVPGPVCRQLSDLAAETDLLILAGMAEYNPEGAPFAAHCIFQPSGQVQIYRKLHLAPPELPFFSAGNEIPVFKYKETCLGIQLCYDAHFPELCTQMVAKGAEVIFFPHASPRGDAPAKHQSWMRHLPARAFDNSIYVLACNQIGANGRGLHFPGNAVAIDPSGNVMAHRLEKSEGLLVVDLRASALEMVRSHPMRYFFPNRRTDLY